MMRTLLCLVSILTILSLVAACAPNNQTQPNEPDQYDDAQQNHSASNQQVGVRDDVLNPFNITSNEEAQEVADRLVELATQLEHVNDATAVVVGGYAVVGIDVDAELDRSEVGTIKYSVAEALKADPLGAYAIVTADADTNYRLREMYRDIQEGRPIAGVMDELAAIVGRLMPQVPRNVPDPKNRP